MEEGFNEWTAYTNLDDEQVRIVCDLGLFQAFDFYWDPTEDRLRTDPPAIPDDCGSATRLSHSIRARFH